MSASPPPAPGTRPAGVAAEGAAAHVRAMFDRIAPTYDRANHLLSLSVDRYWRWRTVRALRLRLPPHPRVPLRILDVCCGTGDLSLALAAGLAPGATIVGADFSLAMLQRARAKSGPRLEWIQADALRLPYPDASFAAVTSAFGFRNLADYRAGLAEFFRLLAPGGTLAILEISRPSLPVLAQLYPFYFQRLLPRLGGWISGHPAAYRYLPDSVSRFPNPPQLAQWMREAGFSPVRFTRFAGGLASLHLATRPAAVSAHLG
ncbi:MAG TPA: bifunctional demethylmenaquinone methyltransferase/2-methoxy-6-polyprenyl-1,4-benzoquinol methylase UbiE [Terriglobales bacterium]|nr:bifunctional demethylmenaquinone methyltransferase/2-methoxy-6-polyprenyl-1,4-benzoquinol methylase UbiE [Terriglobales bacterium]